VTLRLNELFARPSALPSAAMDDLRGRQGRRESLADLAIRAPWNVVQGPSGSVGHEHIRRWPRDQQNLLRHFMILSIEKDMPMSFDWHTSSGTATDVVLFDGRIGVTFSSPLVYPPYWTG
jgi:hypothetical protein